MWKHLLIAAFVVFSPVNGYPAEATTEILVKGNQLTTDTTTSYAGISTKDGTILVTNPTPTVGTTELSVRSNQLTIMEGKTTEAEEKPKFNDTKDRSNVDEVVTSATIESSNLPTTTENITKNTEILLPESKGKDETITFKNADTTTAKVDVSKLPTVAETNTSDVVTEPVLKTGKEGKSILLEEYPEGTKVEKRIDLSSLSKIIVLI